jgi:hypothetical protein
VRANDPKSQLGQDKDKDAPRSTTPSPSRSVSFDPTHVLGVIRDLSAFQLSCLHTDRAYKSAEALLQDRPDELLNRTVAHVKYLFGVPSLEGIAPFLPPSPSGPLSLRHTFVNHFSTTHTPPPSSYPPFLSLPPFPPLSLFPPLPPFPGLLPRMNQVYLSAEEAKNFLNTMRDLLQVEKKGIAGEGSDSDLFSEITRRLSASTSGTTSFPRKSYVAPEEL